MSSEDARVTGEAPRVRVAYYEYPHPGGEALSDRDLKAMYAVLPGKLVSVFRMKRRAEGAWHWRMAVVGLEDQVPEAMKANRFGILMEGEPEPGISEALVKRFIAHLEQTVASGRSFGRVHYGLGARLDRDGGMNPRAGQG